MKIGFFDSGLGGLTIFNKAIKEMPFYQYIYMADNKNAPYGKKEGNVVKKYIFKCVDELVNRNCKIIVIACNTATSLAINDLRQKYKDIIIIGTEPAIKKAADESKNLDRILVCATSITIKEKKLNDLIEKLHVKNRTDLIALDKLVEFIESGCINVELIKKYLNDSFKNIDKSKYSHVVLGCTHFPILKEYFKEIFGKEVNIIDGSTGVVNNLKNKIKQCNFEIDNEFSLELLLTKEDKVFIKNFKKISELNEFKLLDCTL